MKAESHKVKKYNSLRYKIITIYCKKNQSKTKKSDFAVRHQPLPKSLLWCV